jgi:hypothetical protein
MLLPRTTFFINLATVDDADDATRLILALKGPCVEERARGQPMRKIPQTPWKTDAAVIVSLGSKWCAWRPASRREDRTRGYEMANSSMAVVPSGPCNVQGGLGAG